MVSSPTWMALIANYRRFIEGGSRDRSSLIPWKLWRRRRKVRRPTATSATSRWKTKSRTSIWGRSSKEHFGGATIIRWSLHNFILIVFCRNYFLFCIDDTWFILMLTLIDQANFILFKSKDYIASVIITKQICILGWRFIQVSQTLFIILFILRRRTFFFRRHFYPNMWIFIT